MLPKTSPIAESSHPSSARIVVIDDEPMAQLHIAGLLQYLDCTTLGILSADNAYATIRHQQPQLVIVDLKLSNDPADGSGWTVLDQLNSDPFTADIPVIVISAYTTARIHARLTERGIKSVLEKPLQAVPFYAAVRPWLKRSP